jgi:membrane protein
LVSIRRLLVKIRRWWLTRPPTTQALPKYLWRAVSNYAQSGAGSRQAAALSYYAIFSIFPLTLLLVIAVGTILGPAVAQEQILNGLEIFLPETMVGVIQDIVTEALQQSSSFSLVATAALLWSATGLFTNITNSLDTIFDMPGSRSMVRQRLMAIIMGLTLVVLVGASFMTSGVLRLVSALTPGVPSLWVRIGIFFLPIGLDVVIFALLFQYVPDRDVHWDAVWPAAIFGAIGWEFAKQGFEWYLTNLANYAIIYGSIATVIVLLFWAWVIASVFLFSAEVCARLNDWLIEEDERQLRHHYEQDRIAIYLQEGHLSAPVLDDVANVISTQNEGTII